MRFQPSASSLRHLLVVLLLVAGQSMAFAHDVDEVSHPAKTVCDLCIAGHPLGAAAGGQASVPEFPPVAGAGLLPEIWPLAGIRTWLSPGQRAPPISH